MLHALEPRQLLSSSLSGGVLTVTGTSSADTIDLTISGPNIVVNEHVGSTKSYVTTSVNTISIDAKEGNDKVTVSESILKRCTIYGGTGNDTIKGGGANDSIRGNDGNDELHGRAGNDTVRGDANNDACFGEAGDDILDGGGSTDYLDGGTGNDTADYSSRTSPITVWIRGKSGTGGEGGETDTINEYVETVRGGSGNDTFLFGEDTTGMSPLRRYVRLDGGAGNDEFREQNFNPGNVSATLVGGDGNDRFSFGESGGFTASVYGGAGDDTVYPSLEGTGLQFPFVDMGAGTDTFDMAGSHPAGSTTIDMRRYSSLERVLNSPLNVIGNDLGNYISLVDGQSYAQGNEGNDTIVGSNNSCTLDGGAGNDVIRPQLSDPSTNGTKVIGGSGNDTVDYSGFATAVKISLDNVANDGAAASPRDNVSSDIETVLGGSGNDTIIGSGGNNYLKGNGGNDSIRGGNGNDTLDGGTGADQLFGEGGDDTLYALDGTKDTVDGGTGTDKAHRDAIDILTSIESTF